MLSTSAKRLSAKPHGETTSNQTNTTFYTVRIEIVILQSSLRLTRGFETRNFRPPVTNALRGSNQNQTTHFVLKVDVVAPAHDVRQVLQKTQKKFDAEAENDVIGGKEMIGATRDVIKTI